MIMLLSCCVLPQAEAMAITDVMMNSLNSFLILVLFIGLYLSRLSCGRMVSSMWGSV
jgi:hypothetical protein